LFRQLPSDQGRPALKSRQPSQPMKPLAVWETSTPKVSSSTLALWGLIVQHNPDWEIWLKLNTLGDFTQGQFYNTLLSVNYGH